MTLPWSNRVGLLIAFYLFSFGGAPSWAMVVSWVAVTTSGHSKVRCALLINLCAQRRV
jgi:hypothetical protein